MILGWVVMAFRIMGLVFTRYGRGPLGSNVWGLSPGDNPPGDRGVHGTGPLSANAASVPLRAGPGMCEESLALMRYEIQLWGNVLWWLLLPLALGEESAALAFAWSWECIG